MGSQPLAFFSHACCMNEWDFCARTTHVADGELVLAAALHAGPLVRGGDVLVVDFYVGIER